MDSASARARAAKKNVGAPLGKRVQNTYPIDKPSRSKFVRVHPDEKYRKSYVPTYKEEETGEIYFVDPNLLLPEEIANQIKMTDLYAAQAQDGTFFVRYVNKSDTSWYRSANQAVRRCSTQWFRVVARKSANIYDLYEPEHTIDEPDWSAGALAPDVVRDKMNAPEIERIRTIYKVADLAIKYGIGGQKLAPT